MYFVIYEVNLENMTHSFFAFIYLLLFIQIKPSHYRAKLFIRHNLKCVQIYKILY